MKKIRYALESVLLHMAFFVFGLLSAEKASDIGGWLGRTIGSHLAVNRKARANLRRAMPGIAQEKENKIITGMWDNLGRVIAEYPHLDYISQHCTTVENTKRLEALLQSDQPIVFFGAHLANWEVNAATLLTQHNKTMALTYRAPNNPHVEALLHKTRTLGGRLPAFPKSRESGKALLQVLRDGGALGILIDQKYNEGVEVPFFSLPAMTNPIFAQLCRKYKCPLIPVKNERIGGCRFKLTPYPPLAVHDTHGEARPIEDIIADAHTLLEAWIKDRPEQWIWLHRRWKDEGISAEDRASHTL